MSRDEQKLAEVVQAIYERRADEIRISPAWLATEAMHELDPTKVAPELVYRAAHLQLRQIARFICRQRFEPDEGPGEQSEMFPMLQTRYPVPHAADAEPEYVLLHHLEEADVRFNVNRLRAEAAAKQAHADALEAWWQSRAA